MGKEDIDIYRPNNRNEWRQWLEKNHREKKAVWLVQYRLSTNVPSLSWSEAVDEALCFGWIDSTRKTVDESSFMQLFTRRKANSTWSKINKDKIRRLIADGLMTQAGYESIETAKQNGYWTLMDEVEELIIPEDLEEAFDKYQGSRDYFLGLSRSVRKMMLHWIVLAKLPETRQKRIAEIVEHASQKQKPPRF